MRALALALALARTMTSPASPRILLIDDDELIRDVFTMILTRRFEVDSAATGEEALELLVRVFGKDHVNTTSTLLEIAQGWVQSGDMRRALAIQEDVLRIQARRQCENLRKMPANKIDKLQRKLLAPGDYPERIFKILRCF